jgi:hypothetical protein
MTAIQLMSPSLSRRTRFMAVKRRPRLRSVGWTLGLRVRRNNSAAWPDYFGGLGIRSSQYRVAGWHLKSITAAPDRTDHVRAEALKRAADMPDMDVDSSGFHLHMRGPAAFDEIVALANDGGRLQKATQETKLQSSQCHLFTGPMHCHRRKVHFKVGKSKHRSWQTSTIGGKM